MARLTNSDRELILADFHTGHFSQRKLAEKYDVSTATINKMTKGIDPKHLEKVNAQVSINTALASQSKQEVNAFTSVVNDRTKHLIYFQNSALNGQQKANDLLDEVSDMKDILAYANITKTNKETVLGKDVEQKPTDTEEILDIIIE
jgi:DNA-binding MurR/RpiR family transcriptional regulator